jgi:hypothetical protein
LLTARAGSYQVETARSIERGELDGEVVLRPSGAYAISPLEGDYGFLTHFLKTQVQQLGGTGEAVGIEVEERGAAGMLVQQDIGGATDATGHFHPLRQALDEAGLAAAELPTESKEVSSPHKLAECAAPALGLRRGSGEGGEGGSGGRRGRHKMAVSSRSGRNEHGLQYSQGARERQALAETRERYFVWG